MKSLLKGMDLNKLNFNKSNYNNLLEKVLENKNFTANTKSLLLSMLYKIEYAYKDYKTVKVLVKTKEEILKEIINTIDKKCLVIKLVEPNSNIGIELIKSDKLSYIENGNKLISLPTEKALFIGITLLMENNFYVHPNYKLIDVVITNFLKESFCINLQECMFNFDGWSWNNQFNKETQFLYNIIYYNLMSISGIDVLEEWRFSNNKIDYIERLTRLLISHYGENHVRRLLLLFYRLFLKLLILNYDVDDKDLLDEEEKLKNTIDYMNDKSKYMQDIYDKKKEINDRINEIEKIMLDKNLLVKKYVEENSNLPLEKQIFSPKVFLNMLKQEREKLYVDINNYNLALDPKRYTNEKQNLENQYLKFKDLNKIKKSHTSLKRDIIRIQSRILEIEFIKLNKMETKKEILQNIYKLRYYKNLKLDNDNFIKTNLFLKKSLLKYERRLLSIACANKIFIKFSDNILKNIEFLSEILDTNIINLKEINIMIKNENNEMIVDVYDGEIFDTSFVLKVNAKDIALKKNKKIKLINS